MSYQNIPKELFQKLKEAGAETLVVKLEGGNDEAIIDVDVLPYTAHSGAIARDVEDWVWNSFCFSGAGDGNPFGENYTYDLKKGTVHSESWYTEVVPGDKDEESFTVGGEEAEE
jgi:hypothetical protein